MSGVEVRRERLEEFARSPGAAGAFDAATARAVGNFETLVPLASHCLKPGGRLFLWLSRRQTSAIGYQCRGMRKAKSLLVPGGAQGEIWWGEKSVAEGRAGVETQANERS